MSSENWAFSPGGGARALDWSAEVGRTKQAELRAGSTAEPVEREPRQRGNVTSGDLKLGICARASCYRRGLTYVPRADWQDPQRAPPRGRRGQTITAAALAIKLGPTIEDLTATFRSCRTFSEGIKLAPHRVAARGVGQLPLQDSNLDYSSAGPRAPTTDKLTGSGVPTSIGA